MVVQDVQPHRRDSLQFLHPKLLSAKSGHVISAVDFFDYKAFHVVEGVTTLVKVPCYQCPGILVDIAPVLVHTCLQLAQCLSNVLGVVAFVAVEQVDYVGVLTRESSSHSESLSCVRTREVGSDHKMVTACDARLVAFEAASISFGNRWGWKSGWHQYVP